MIDIVRWRDHAARDSVVSAVDAIFFANAARTFVPGPERETFRRLWLGQYLESEPDLVWLAVASEGAVAGYLVGCLVDPATSPRFAALGFVADFAEVSRRFPAHLHLNLAAEYRTIGIGGRLVAAFADQARSLGAPGVHVVTGAASRNVRFYRRQGFVELARSRTSSRDVVCLGRVLTELPGAGR